jgi:hypothetical protein
MTDQSEVENQKNTIVAITKKLVLCYRTITGLYEDPLKSSNTEQVLKRAHAILSDSIRKFAPKHSSASSQKILDNVKQISIFFEQLAKDFNTAQGDESKQVFNGINEFILFTFALLEGASSVFKEDH